MWVDGVLSSRMCPEEAARSMAQAASLAELALECARVPSRAAAEAGTIETASVFFCL